MAETLIQKQLYELFANSAKTLSRLAGKREDKTEEEWVLNGVKNLKRKTLGLIGIRKTFSLEDLAKILKNDLEIGEDIEEAREIIRGLYNKKLEYSKDDFKASLRMSSACSDVFPFLGPLPVPTKEK